MDPYTILGVSTSASLSDVADAYQSLRRKVMASPRPDSWELRQLESAYRKVLEDIRDRPATPVEEPPDDAQIQARLNYYHHQHEKLLNNLRAPGRLAELADGRTAVGESSDSSPETRHGERVDLQGSVLLALENGACQVVQLRDVSLDGLRVKPRRPLTIGQYGTVTAELATGTSVQFEVQVVRADPADGSFGMQIREMDWNSRKNLKDLMEAIQRVRDAAQKGLDPARWAENHRREHPRMAFETQLWVTDEKENVMAARLRDVSMGGLRIHPEFPLTTGENCQIAVELTFGARIVFAATVVRTEPDGSVGMRISDIDWASMRQLEGLINAGRLTQGDSGR